MLGSSGAAFAALGRAARVAIDSSHETAMPDALEARLRQGSGHLGQLEEELLSGLAADASGAEHAHSCGRWRSPPQGLRP